MFGWADEKWIVIALSRLVCMAGSERSPGSEKRSWIIGAERLKTVGVESVS